MNFPTMHDFTFEPIPLNNNISKPAGDSFKSLMTEYEKESSTMKHQTVRNIHQPLPFQTLSFSSNPTNTPTTLADILGKVDEAVFDTPESLPQANTLINLFEDDVNQLPPLPAESSIAPSQKLPEAVQSIDKVISMFGTSNNCNTENCTSLEPTPMFTQPEKKRSLSPTDMELLGSLSSPNKKQKTEETSPTNLFRSYQAEQWTERFHELCDFVQKHGHTQVPHTFTENPALARWVKRQRYQYKLRVEKKQSTMTDDRIMVLEKIRFVWDSHIAAWEERRNELIEYKKEHGNCNVPSNYENHQLAIWVKRQRRQYKFFWAGKASSMTNERIEALEKIGFEWELRCRGDSSNY